MILFPFKHIMACLEDRVRLDITLIHIVFSFRLIYDLTHGHNETAIAVSRDLSRDLSF